MKKKTIEKIPYLTGTKCNDRKMKYVAAVAIKAIDHKQHLLLEIYENKKKSLDVPVIRFAYTKTDWGNYEPENEVWSASSIRYAMPDTRTHMSKQDVEKIARFTKKRVYNQERWWGYLECLEKDIKDERREKVYEKRRNRLNERCAAVGDLPEDFEEWYKNELFAKENYIYYKRKGRYATFWCSHCGKSYTYATEALDTYEGQFEHVVNVPRRGGKARCELCDTQGLYKAVGNMKNVYGLKKMCYVGQKYKDTGFVSRYFHIEKILSIGEPEKYIVVEIARSFFEKSQNRIKDYHLYNPWTGQTEWYDHNIGGMGAQVHEGTAYIYPGTYEALKDTDLRYCALQEYMQNYDEIELPAYLEFYMQHNQVEMLIKMRLHKLISNMVENHYYWNRYVKDKSATSLEKLLGISSAHKRIFLESEGDAGLLNILQIERELNATWTDEQCENLAIMRPDERKLMLALQHMTVQKFLNRVVKYSGVDIGEGLCGHAFARVVHASTTYLDYLEMRNRLGYDMSNTVYPYPRDLETAHQKMVIESNGKELKKRMLEVGEKYPNIRKNYRRLRRKYFYADEDMIIRPAKSAEEIVEEGRTLHHCVGGDGYLSKHNNGDSIILMLRFKTSPNTPYITVEIAGNRIIQWYGANDEKPDKKNMQKWLDEYVKRLKDAEKESNGAVVEIPAQVAG